MDTISVIIPVYNVEQYLPKCIESVMGQTYPELDIILVDDGSTDASGRICDAYAEQDARIRVIHQKNQGVSAARNAGIRVVQGKYIAFVDSDDVVEDIFLQRLRELMVQYDAEIAVCGYVREDQISDLHGQEGISYCLDAETMLRQWHGKRKAMETVLWNKLYRKELLQNSEMIFPEGKIHEDSCLSHLIISNASRIAITECKLYHYRNREESIVHDRSTQARKQDLEAQKERMDYFREHHYYASYVRLLIGHILHRIKYRFS